MRPAVLELTIIMLYDFASVSERDKRRIAQAIDRYVYPVNHARNSVSLLVVTRETPAELLKRVGPAMKELGCVDDWRCVSLGTLVAAKNGINDPFVQRLAGAWRKADQMGKRTKPEDLQQIRTADILAKHGVGVDLNAAVKMGLRGAWKREATPAPYDPSTDPEHVFASFGGVNADPASSGEDV